MMASVSDFTLFLTALTAAQQGEMTFTRPSWQYTLRELTVTFGGVTEPMAVEVLSEKETKVVYGFTPPLYWCGELPDTVSGNGTVTATVAFDSAIDALDDPSVCTLSAPFTLYVPESLRPAAVLRTNLVYGSDVAEQWGTPLRGISRLQFAVSASAPMGAEVEQCTVSVGAQQKDAVSGVLPPFTAAGTFTPTAVVRDSRGRTAEGQADPVTVWDYHRPTLSGLSVLRCLSDGTADSGGGYLKVRATAKCAAVDGRNSVSLTVRIRPVGGTWGSAVTLIGGEARVLTASADAVYEAQFTAADTLGSETVLTALSGTAAVAFQLRDGGMGAAFGKRAESDGLHCAWDACFDGDLTAAGKVTAASLQVGGRSLLDLTYPIGAVYISMSPTSPGDIFGGTWKKLEDRFLLGASSNYGAGAAGGAATRTLTVENLPAHSHRVKGDTAATNVGHNHTIPNIRTGQSGEYSAYAETWGYGTGSRDLYTDHTDITHIHRLDITSQTTGSGTAFSVMPPYLAVHMWRRTA